MAHSDPIQFSQVPPLQRGPLIIRNILEYEALRASNNEYISNHLFKKSSELKIRHFGREAPMIYSSIA